MVMKEGMERIGGVEVVCKWKEGEGRRREGGDTHSLVLGLSVCLEGSDSREEPSLRHSKGRSEDGISIFLIFTVASHSP